jgi:hypothetical protein
MEGEWKNGHLLEEVCGEIEQVNKTDELLFLFIEYWHGMNFLIHKQLYQH